MVDVTVQVQHLEALWRPQSIDTVCLFFGEGLLFLIEKRPQDGPCSGADDHNTIVCPCRQTTKISLENINKAMSISENHYSTALCLECSFRNKYYFFQFIFWKTII